MRVGMTKLFGEAEGRTTRTRLTQPERRTGLGFDSAMNAFYIIANYF
jgi:hypothetical protein